MVHLRHRLGLNVLVVKVNVENRADFLLAHFLLNFEDFVSVLPFRVVDVVLIKVVAGHIRDEW